MNDYIERYILVD